MRINEELSTNRQKQQIADDLAQLLAQPSDKQHRPCPNCQGKPDINDTTACSFTCSMAAQKMSSDPERYPIEAKVVPLVYAFYTTRLMTPCWSCEGHNDPSGNVSKKPSLWFYADAEFYPRLVAEFVNELYMHHVIKNDWTVRLLPFSQSPYRTTYSLEPLSFYPGVTDLDSLQLDMLTIAQQLRQGLFKLAENHLQRSHR